MCANCGGTAYESGQEDAWQHAEALLKKVQAKLDTAGRFVSMEGIFINELDEARAIIRKAIEEGLGE